MDESELIELIILARNGNNDAGEKIVMQYNNLVRHIVMRLSNVRRNNDDLVQVGMIGLIKAIKKFSFLEGVKFTTYAYALILGEIKMFLREDSMIKTSRNIKYNKKIINEATYEYENKYGNDITINELKDMTGLDEEEIVLALNYKDEITSIDESFGDRDGEDEGNNISKTLKSKDDTEDEAINNVLIKEIIKKLSLLERKVIIMRYCKEMRQNKIGEALNISQVKVSRIEKDALAKLREIYV